MILEKILKSRWTVAAMGAALMLCLGTVYAWSYFQDLLVREYRAVYGWSNAEVAWVFSLAIFFLGAAAAVGGRLLPRLGPRRLALLGGCLFAAGYLTAGLALASRSLPLLYLGFGAIGGTGLGLGYVTPVASVAKWFPDRKGLATGLVVMGFGFGALVMSKLLAPRLLELSGGRLDRVFMALAALFLAGTAIPALFLRNPPAADGAAPAEAAEAGPARDPAKGARRAIGSGRFALVWLVFFCNIAAGIAIIGFQSPLLQDLLRKGGSGLDAAGMAAAGATLIAASSLFNGAGRFLWGAVTDRLGGARAFRLMLGTEILVFAALIATTLASGGPWLFGGLVCYVLLCYGGGFGAMPAFIGEAFGAELLPAVYGAVLTAWSCAGIAGPQVVARIKDLAHEGAAPLSFAVGLGFVSLGFALSWFLAAPPQKP
ncbi:MAG: OFA family MFS transporter [Spirochaetaceae bacterium]|nr:OFA family MFS transporter [Spirochaetaceae bacterium]